MSNARDAGAVCGGVADGRRGRLRKRPRSVRLAEHWWHFLPELDMYLEDVAQAIFCST